MKVHGNPWLALWSAVALTAAVLPALSQTGSISPGAVVKSEFIIENPPHPFNHSSSIVETDEGLLVAWVAGSAGRSLDNSIYIARPEGEQWSTPVQVATGSDPERGIQYPCWNPVLFQPRMGPLRLFYKVGRSPETWWGMQKYSGTSGRVWSEPRRLPEGILGPIVNKPVELPNNLILCGSSTESAGWQVHMERLRLDRERWWRSDPLNSPMEFGAIQPAILMWGLERIQILCRTKQGRITESWSTDGGEKWSRMVATELPNPNSALDASVLRDGRGLLVYNHSGADRGILNVALSRDGQKWEAALVLENEPGNNHSYPAVIQTSDGLVHITYSWRQQKIRHVVIDPARLNSVPMNGGQWPQ